MYASQTPCITCLLRSPIMCCPGLDAPHVTSHLNACIQHVQTHASLYSPALAGDSCILGAVPVPLDSSQKVSASVLPLPTCTGDTHLLCICCACPLLGLPFLLSCVSHHIVIGCSLYASTAPCILTYIRLLIYSFFVRNDHPLVTWRFSRHYLFFFTELGFQGCGGCTATVEACGTNFDVCYMTIHAGGTKVEAPRQHLHCYLISDSFVSLPSPSTSPPMLFYLSEPPLLPLSPSSVGALKLISQYRGLAQLT